MIWREFYDVLPARAQPVYDVTPSPGYWVLRETSSSVEWCLADAPRGRLRLDWLISDDASDLKDFLAAARETVLSGYLFVACQEVPGAYRIAGLLVTDPTWPFAEFASNGSPPAWLAREDTEETPLLTAWERLIRS